MKSATDHLIDQEITFGVLISRVAAGVTAEVFDVLNNLEQELLHDLVKGKPDWFQRAKLNKLLKVVIEKIESAYDIIEETQSDSIPKVAKATMRATKAALNSAISLSLPVEIEIDASSISISDSSVAAVVRDIFIEGISPSEWWQKQKNVVGIEITGTIREGVRSGESELQVFERISGTKQMKNADGLIAKIKRDAETLILTTFQTVAQEARLQSYAQDEDLMSGIMWLSVLDGRTTDICKSLSGLKWGNDRQPIGHGKIFIPPPRHMRCRSTTVPILKSWAELAGVKTPDDMTVEAIFRQKIDSDPVLSKNSSVIFRNAQASIDGPVSAKLDYESWLKTKNGEFQQAVLGKKRFELWKNGELSLQDLTDFRGVPLLLDQL